MVGGCDEAVGLQHSWKPWAGWQGIERQQAIICWLAEMRVAQSAACTANSAMDAIARNVVLRIIVSNSMAIRRDRQAFGYNPAGNRSLRSWTARRPAVLSTCSLRAANPNCAQDIFHQTPFREP